MSGEIRLKAVVLGAVDYGDSDKVVTLLSEERGKVAAFAAGARASKRRFAGALSPFTELEVRASQRPSADLLFLRSCEIRDAHAGLRADLGRLGYAGHASELCRELCREGEAHPELYRQLVSYLSHVEEQGAIPEDLLSFELGALGHAGLSPRFADCSICGAEVRGDALFDPGHGGALCGGCASQALPSARPASAEALAAALRLSRGFGGELSPTQRGAARLLVRRFTTHVLGRRPRSLDFLEQMGVEG